MDVKEWDEKVFTVLNWSSTARSGGPLAFLFLHRKFITGVGATAAGSAAADVSQKEAGGVCGQ